MLRSILALLLVLAAMLPLPPSIAAPPRAPGFASNQDILRWINGYRQKPEPQRLGDAAHAMQRLGLLHDLEAGGIYVGFIAGVIGSNPETAEKLVASLFPMPPPDQVVIVRAIAYSGLGGWKELLGRFVERMPARKVLIERLIDGKLPTLATLKLEAEPAAIDLNWGYYFATGRPEPINRIVDTLAWAKDANNAERLTAASMAKWTLANNALQDKDLLDHLKAEMARRPKPIAAELGEVIEAAETFETSKIRKEAQASIEEIKRKGPASSRKLTFWGQAGSTAIALGCVVAGVTGHPEVAVPCVVGGAVSSAALKVLTPQQ